MSAADHHRGASHTGGSIPGGAREAMGRALEGWARFVVRRPWLVLGAALALSAWAVVGVSELHVETSAESFLKKHDPARTAYDEFRREFGNDDRILLLLEADDVFAPAFLGRVRALHEDLEQSLPHLDEVTSLINARATYGREDELIVEDLLEGWPEDPDVLERSRRRALDNPLYRNVLLTGDGRHTAVHVELLAVREAGGLRMLNMEEGGEVVARLDEVLSRHRSEDFPILMTGRQPVAVSILSAMRADMRSFTLYSIALIAVLLGLLFRRVSGVVLTLATVTTALAATFGALGHAGIPLSPAGQILPSFLLAVGVGGAVHILAIFYLRFDAGGSRAESLIEAVGHSGFAVVMTSLTTAVCLLSFAAGDLGQLVRFGLSASAGVTIALLYVLVLLPAMLAVVPIRRRVRSVDAAAGTRSSRIDRVLAAAARLGTERPTATVGVWSVLMAAALVGAVQLEFEHEPVKWLPATEPTRIGTEAADRILNGGSSYEVIVDSGRPEGLYEPRVMHALDRMRAYVEATEVSDIRAGRVISVADIVKETHRALNANDAEFFAVPDSRQLIAQELLLFEMSGADDVEKTVDVEFRKARLSILVPVADGLDQGRYMRTVERELQNIAGADARVVITGHARLYARTHAAMISSTAKSYALAVVMLVPLMMLLTGGVGTGLLSMVPNIAPIVMSLGLMHWVGIPLDMFTMLIGSIAIGVAVDDTIHFMHNFRRYYDDTGDSAFAVYETLATTGRAMLVTSIVLAFGFLVFAGATMVNVRNFGCITGFTVMVAFLADATLCPALVTLAVRRGAFGSRGVVATEVVLGAEDGEGLQADSAISVS